MRKLTIWLIFFFLLTPVLAFGNIYRFVSDDGMIHFTTCFECIPECYRSKATLYIDEEPAANRKPQATLPKSRVSKIPFLTSGSHMLVRVKINSNGPIMLILEVRVT